MEGRTRKGAIAQILPTPKPRYPEMLDEMRGASPTALGGLTHEDILTLNVRVRSPCRIMRTGVLERGKVGSGKGGGQKGEGREDERRGGGGREKKKEAGSGAKNSER